MSRSRVTAVALVAIVAAGAAVAALAARSRREPTGVALKPRVSQTGFGLDEQPLGRVLHYGACVGTTLAPGEKRPVTLLGASVGRVPPGVEVTYQLFTGMKQGGGIGIGYDDEANIIGFRPLAGYTLVPGLPSHGTIVSLRMDKPGRYRVGPLRIRYRVGGRTYHQSFPCWFEVSTLPPNHKSVITTS